MREYHVQSNSKLDDLRVVAFVHERLLESFFSGDEEQALADLNSHLENGEFNQFEAEVRPAIIDRCLRCHGPEKQESGLRLDARQAMLTGGESRAAIVAGQADQSAIWQRIAAGEMPPVRYCRRDRSRRYTCGRTSSRSSSPLDRWRPTRESFAMASRPQSCRAGTAHRCRHHDVQCAAESG